MSEALALAGGAGAFAGEAAGDDFDSGSVSANCSDVGVDGDAWEPLPEDSLPELVGLAEPGVLKAGEVESVGKESAAIEESADTQHLASHAEAAVGSRVTAGLSVRDPLSEPVYDAAPIRLSQRPLHIADRRCAHGVLDGLAELRSGGFQFDHAVFLYVPVDRRAASPSGC